MRRSLLPLVVTLALASGGCGTTMSQLVAERQLFQACQLLDDCRNYYYSGTNEEVVLGKGCKQLRIHTPAERAAAQRQLVAAVAHDSDVRLQLGEFGLQQLQEILKTVGVTPPADVLQRTLTLGVLVDNTRAPIAVHVREIELEHASEPLRRASQHFQDYVAALGGPIDHSPTAASIVDPTPLYRKGGLLGLAALLGHMMTAGIFLVPDLLQQRERAAQAKASAQKEPAAPPPPPPAQVSWRDQPSVELIGQLGTPGWHMRFDEPGELVPSGSSRVVTRAYLRDAAKAASFARPAEPTELHVELGLRLYRGAPPPLPEKLTDPARPWLNEPAGSACLVPHIYLHVPLASGTKTLTESLAELAARGPQPLDALVDAYQKVY